MKIGAKLEKKGLIGFRAHPRGGVEVYFRCHGLQVIPSEAEEIDTHHACQLVITPLAAGLSGLIFSILRILNSGQDGKRRALAAIGKFAQILATDRADGWEMRAAKDMVSASISMTEAPFPPAPEDKRSPEFLLESENSHFFFRRNGHWHELQQRLSQLSDRDLEAIGRRHLCAGDHQASTQHDALDGRNWLTLRNVSGVILERCWIPVHFPARPLTCADTRGIIKAITRKGLRPEIAMAIMANHPKKFNRTRQ